jgi:hypothetical protein
MRPGERRSREELGTEIELVLPLGEENLDLEAGG